MTELVVNSCYCLNNVGLYGLIVCYFKNNSYLSVRQYFAISIGIYRVGKHIIIKQIDRITLQLNIEWTNRIDFQLLLRNSDTELI